MKDDRPVFLKRTNEIRKMVREQIASHIEKDMGGDEQLMKEVWEEMASVDETEVAKEEMQEIIDYLRELP